VPKREKGGNQRFFGGGGSFLLRGENVVIVGNRGCGERGGKGGGLGRKQGAFVVERKRGWIGEFGTALEKTEKTDPNRYEKKGKKKEKGFS